MLVASMSLPNMAFTQPLARHLKAGSGKAGQPAQGEDLGLLADGICFFPAAVVQLQAR